MKAWSYGLDRYLLLYGDNGVVVGASYTDVHVGLPGLWLMIGLSIIAAFAALANLRVRTYRLPAAAVMLVGIGSFVLSGVVPVLFRQFFVKPSELQLEKPYIERNIALTRQAYNLDQIAAKPFAAEQKLTFKTLEANKATIENIRLWDWLPLSDTYAQLQEIRTYYKFHDLDVDRYWLDGSYQSVMLSARELRPSLLPPNAQTWVNRHVLFTHGNGAVMSPVTRKSTEGLPFFYLRDIPPVADGGPKIHEPRIYYGEERDDYVIVKGSTPEFDYPKGKDNVYAAYDGAGGVPIGAMVWRAPVCLLLQRPEPAALKLHHRRQPDHDPAQYPGTGAHDRSVPQARSRSLSGYQRRADVLDAGRLHDEFLFPLCAAGAGSGSQLHSQFGEDYRRCL